MEGFIRRAAARGRAWAAGWACVGAAAFAPVYASIPPAAPGAQATPAFAAEAGLSEEAGVAAQRIIATADNGGRPFAIVDKKRARLYLFAPDGRFVAGSTVLLGLAIGDDTIAGIASRTPASLAPGERTTPAGRFTSQPGHNAQGEDVVWFDYAAALAIHRLRPGPAAQHRGERMGSPDSADKRISAGCVVVPVAFYEAVVRPSLGRRPGMVYVLPETRAAGAR